MKKLLIALLLFAIVPTLTMAISGESVSEKRASLQAKIQDVQSRREQVLALVQTKAEIRTQTKEQIQESRQSINALKTEMKVSFQGFKDLTESERLELKDDIDEMKGQMRDLHSAALSIRAVSIEEIVSINETIRDIVNVTEVLPEEVEEIEEILGDL